MTGPSDSSVQVEALKSCPHCGGKAAFVPRAVNLALQKDPSDPKFGISVICGTCSAETGNFIDQAAAAKRWNRRAALPVAHSDHPMRHWDRTCPACNPDAAALPVAALSDADRELMERTLEALELAHTFIRDGVEFGYIKDTTTPDWREALRETRAAIAALRTRLLRHSEGKE